MPVRLALRLRELTSVTLLQPAAQDKHQRRSNSSTPAGSYERPNTFGKHVNGIDKRKVRSGGGNSWDKAAVAPSRPLVGAIPQDGQTGHCPATVKQTPGPDSAAAVAKGISSARVEESAPAAAAALINGVA